jgi:hypothetical protein
LALDHDGACGNVALPYGTELEGDMSVEIGAKAYDIIGGKKENEFWTKDIFKKKVKDLPKECKDFKAGPSPPFSMKTIGSAPTSGAETEEPAGTTTEPAETGGHSPSTTEEPTPETTGTEEPMSETTVEPEPTETGEPSSPTTVKPLPETSVEPEPAETGEPLPSTTEAPLPISSTESSSGSEEESSGTGAEASTLASSSA